MRRNKIDELFKIGKMVEDQKLPRNLSATEELLRDLKPANAFDTLAREQVKRVTEGLTSARLEALHGALIPQLRHHEELLGRQWQSAFASARVELENTFRSQISQLTEGIARSGMVERGLEGLAAGINKSFIDASNIRLRFEAESQRLWQTKEVSSFASSAAVASLISQVNATANMTFASVAQGLHKARLMDEHMKFAERMCQPSFAYNRFATQVVAQLGAGLSESRAASLSSSLLLANEQAIRTASLITPMIELAGSFDPESQPFPSALPPPPIVNLYREQRKELLAEDELPEEATYEMLVPLAPSANLFEQARRCLDLIAMCEETSQTCKGESVFKLTPMFMLSFSSLLGTVACNRSTLTQVVQNLYIVLYEAAGKDKLRYVEGGYVSRDESEVIWRIKHLRNKWLSHDADHGKDSDIKKDRRNRMDALEWFGVKQMPTNKDGYMLIHGCLLNKVEQFLNLLLERIAAPTTT